MATTLSDGTKATGQNSDLWGPSRRAIWDKSAPQAVRRAFRSGGDAKGWAAWTKHLAGRTRPVSLAKLLPDRTSPLTWALPDGVENRGTPAVLEEVERFRRKPSSGGRSPEKALLAWLAEAAGAGPEVGYALEALAWCHALPLLAAALPPELWWDLLDHLLDAASDVDPIQRDDPVAHQLLAGELALALAYLFPEITPCRKLGLSARRVLSAGLTNLLDGEGLPHGKHLGVFRPLLACWTRCSALGSRFPKGCFNRTAQNQYEWLVRNALRLARPDGSHVFSQDSSGAWCEALFAAALRFGGDNDDKHIATVALPGNKRSDAAKIAKRALPEAANHSEWAATTVLRPGWLRSDPRLVAVYTDQSVRIELIQQQDVLCSGVWQMEIRSGGRPLEPVSEWEEVCWISDEDIDYLELEMELSGGLRVQRQMALAREDRFLFLADAILGRRRTKLEYRGCLPLNPGVTYEAADETREGFLVCGKRKCLVFPLALPEWRLEEHLGSLTATECGLELCQSAEGCSMFAPLFFDLQPRRMTRPLTWRQLTVAEKLEIQPPDVAVGYRVRVGREQWLIYRSLAAAANRTLLGHNLSTEMLIGRFDSDGEVEPLVEIE